MTDARIKIILSFLTNFLFGGVVSAAWLVGKIQPETALPVLIAIAGIDVMGRRSENAASRSSEPPSDAKTQPPMPPAGPTAAALLMALESFKHILT